MDFLDKDKDGTISETEFLKFFLTDSPQWLEKLANLDKTIRQLWNSLKIVRKIIKFSHLDLINLIVMVVAL